MAKIEDLVAQIPDERLRKVIAAEVKALKKTKKFGLVFEEHLPETVRLPKLLVKEGELVAKKRESGNDLWRVKTIRKGVASLERAVEGYPLPSEMGVEVPVAELVVVHSFGDPIYPALVPVDRVARGGPDKPWHTLINADNFHALQLLLYAYEDKVDVIYIDPPYNTGARDWKYNNDYVDKTDSFRHSKWLSMIKKRLLLAKRLLRKDGVLIVAIDDREFHRLRCLLDEVVRSAQIQTVTVVVNPKGVTQGRFSKVEETLVYCFNPAAELRGKADDYLTPEPDDGFEASRGTRPRWKGLLRSGGDARREDREDMFYPILIDAGRGAAVGVGKPLPIEIDPKLDATIDGYAAAWPIRTNGEWGRWGVGHQTLATLIAKGFVSVGAFDGKRKTWALSYISQRLREQIESGVLEIVARDDVRNVVDVRYSDVSERRLKTVWKRSRHDAGAHGSDLVRELIGDEHPFPFPKSVYAVADAISPVLEEKKRALVIDFFAGSGTTLHALALLNAADGGARRCILITNNEVEADLAGSLMDGGSFPGDSTFEAHGICNAVTWPRCKNALTGKHTNGTAVTGTYLINDKQGNAITMSSGFDENLEHFRLDFLDPDEVARGDAFKAIVPILWMVAGCRGEREESKGSTPWFIPKHSPFAVLIQEKQFRAFREKLAERKDIEWVFLITDSEENFGQMRRTLGRNYECVQLYKSYLENFRINTQDALNG
jgi:adenine-specific DNA-methyltransferase